MNRFDTLAGDQGAGSGGVEKRCPPRSIKTPAGRGRAAPFCARRWSHAAVLCLSGHHRRRGMGGSEQESRDRAKRGGAAGGRGGAQPSQPGAGRRLAWSNPTRSTAAGDVLSGATALSEHWTEDAHIGGNTVHSRQEWQLSRFVVSDGPLWERLGESREGCRSANSPPGSRSA
jgi:hypothetical protein